MGSVAGGATQITQPKGLSQFPSAPLGMLQTHVKGTLTPCQSPAVTSRVSLPGSGTGSCWELEGRPFRNCTKLITGRFWEGSKQGTERFLYCLWRRKYGKTERVKIVRLCVDSICQCLDVYTYMCICSLRQISLLKRGEATCAVFKYYMCQLVLNCLVRSVV